MAKVKEVKKSIGAEYDYGVTRIRDKSGKVRHSRGNGDAVAKAMLLHRANGGALDSIISANKLTNRMAGHADKAEGLKRMVLGVMLRALVRAGTPVKIGKTLVESLNQDVDLPDVEIKSPKVKEAKANKSKSRRAKVEARAA